MDMLEKNQVDMEGVHGGNGFGLHNTSGERILEFCDAVYMMVSNTLCKRKKSRLGTFKSGWTENQID